MKERPILFSGEMVRAILDGRKTMTRRVITKAKLVPVADGISRHFVRFCPYGQTGDRLWVRETWRVGSWREDEGQIAVDFKADGFPHQKWRTVPDPDKFNDLWEESTLEAQALYGVKERYNWAPGKSPCRWRSSLFMPRWASRITLEITAVRVERLKDLSEARELEAEGFVSRFGGHLSDDYADMWEQFVDTWNRLNAKRGYGWDANPWVWVISFKRVK